MSAEGDEAERLQVLEQYRKKVSVVVRNNVETNKKCHRFRRLFLPLALQEHEQPPCTLWSYLRHSLLSTQWWAS